jgi:hypothetical protein
VFKTQLNRNLTNLKIKVNSKLKQLSEGKRKINFLEANDHLSAFKNSSHFAIDVGRENSESRNDRNSENFDKQSSGDIKQDSSFNYGSTDSIKEIKISGELNPNKMNLPDLSIAVSKLTEDKNSEGSKCNYTNLLV